MKLSSKKLTKFKQKEILDIENINGGAEIRLFCVTANWKGWFDGSLFTEGKINEFDSPCNSVSPTNSIYNNINTII
jgi:hypothetical protein